MQKRTLRECGRLFKQQLQQQEEISLQVLDQVQESLSLLRTLYHSRVHAPLPSAAANGGDAPTDSQRPPPAELVSLTLSQKEENESGELQQSAGSTRWRSVKTPSESMDKEALQPVCDAHDKLSDVSCENSSRRLPPYEGLNVSARKEPSLQQLQIQPTPAHKHTSLIDSRKGPPVEHLQRSRTEHERRVHSKTLSRRRGAASSSPTYIRKPNSRSAKATLLLHAPRLLPCAVLRSAVPAAVVAGPIVNAAPPSAAHLGPLCSLSRKPPEYITSTLTPKTSQNGTLERISPAAEDVSYKRAVPESVSTASSLSPCSQRDGSTFPGTQSAHSDALHCAKERRHVSSEYTETLTPLTAHQPESEERGPLSLEHPPPAVAATSASLQEQSSKFEYTRHAVACPGNSVEDGGFPSSATAQDQTKQRKVSHEGRCCPCCTARGGGTWDAESEPPSRKSSPAPAACSAERPSVKNRTELQMSPSRGGSSQAESCRSVQRATNGGAQVSSTFCTEVGVCMSRRPAAASKTTAADPVARSDAATEASSPVAADGAASESRSSNEAKDLACASLKSRVDASSHEPSCTGNSSKISHAHPSAGGASRVRTQESPSGKDACCFRDILHVAQSDLLRNHRHSCGRSRLNISNNIIPAKFSALSVPAREEEGAQGEGRRNCPRSWPSTNAEMGDKALPEYKGETGGVLRHGPLPPQDSLIPLFHKAASRRQTPPPFEVQRQQDRVRGRNGHPIRDTFYPGAPPEATFHVPYSGEALLTEVHAVNFVRGEASSAFSPPLVSNPENECAVSNSATVATQECGAASAVYLANRGSGQKEEMTPSYMAPPAPPCHAPLGVACTQKHRIAFSRPPAGLVPVRLGPVPAEASPTAPLSTTCCRGLQQSAASRFVEARHTSVDCGRACCLWLCSRCCLSVVASSESSGFSTELSPLPGLGGNSDTDPLSYCVCSSVDNKRCKGVARVTPVSCGCTASSKRLLPAPPVASTERPANGLEGRRASLKTHGCPSCGVPSCLHRRSRHQGTTDGAPAASSLSPTAARPQDERRRTRRSCTTAGIPKRAECQLCCCPFRYSAFSGNDADELQRARSTTCRGLSVLRRRAARTASVSPGVRPPPEATDRTFRFGKQQEDGSLPSLMGGPAFDGTDGKAPQDAQQIRTRSGTSYCCVQTGDEEQLPTFSCPGGLLRIHRHPSAAPQLAKLTQGENSNQSTAAAHQIRTCGARTRSSSQVPRRPQWQEWLEEWSSPWRSGAAQPDRATDIPARCPPDACEPLFNDEEDMRRTGDALVALSSRGRSVAPGEVSYDCVASSAATHCLPLSRRPREASEHRTACVRRVEPRPQHNADYVPFHRRQQCQDGEAACPLISRNAGPHKSWGRRQKPAPVEDFVCADKTGAHEESRSHISAHHKTRNFPCSLLRCSPVQKEAASQRSPLTVQHESAKPVNPFPLPLAAGSAGSRSTASRFQRLSSCRLSTASTHAGDSASAEIFPELSSSVGQDEVCLLGREAGGFAQEPSQQLAGALAGGGSTTSEDGSQRTECISPGTDMEQSCRVADRREPACRQSHLSRGEKATGMQWHLSVPAYRRYTPSRESVVAPSSTRFVCCPNATATYNVERKEDGELEGYLLGTPERKDVSGSIGGATSKELSGFSRKQPPRKAGSSQLQNQLRHLRTRREPDRCNGMSFPSASQSGSGASEREEGCVAAVDHHGDPEPEGLAAGRDSECPAAADTTAPESRTSSHRSSYILRLAAAEAVAILRHEE